MDFQVVQNQKDFLWAIGDQLAQERDEQVRIHRRIDEAKSHQPLVANGRHQRQPRPAAGSRQHRRFPLGASPRTQWPSSTTAVSSPQ